MSDGILSQKKPPKQNFMDVFQEDAIAKSRQAEKVKEAALKDRPKEEEISKLQNALSGANEKHKEVEKELEELDRYSEEDLKLAEELLFQGYAKKNYKITPTMSATFYTINANEVSVINEMMFEFTKTYELKDGRIDLSQKSIDQVHGLYMLSVAFKGYNDKDISESKGRSLDLIKAGLKHLSTLEMDGKIDEYKKLMEEIKDAIKKRSAEIKRGSASVLDVLSMKRFEFERLMYDILNKGEVLPKS